MEGRERRQLQANLCSRRRTRAWNLAAFLMMSVSVASQAGLAGPSPPSMRNTGPLRRSHRLSLKKNRWCQVRVSEVEKWSNFCLNHCGSTTLAPGGSGGALSPTILLARGRADANTASREIENTSRKTTAISLLHVDACAHAHFSIVHFRSYVHRHVSCGCETWQRSCTRAPCPALTRARDPSPSWVRRPTSQNCSSATFLPSWAPRSRTR